MEVWIRCTFSFYESLTRIWFCVQFSRPDNKPFIETNYCSWKTICVVTATQEAVFPRVSEGRLKRTGRGSMRRPWSMNGAPRRGLPSRSIRHRWEGGGRPRGQIWVTVGRWDVPRSMSQRECTGKGQVQGWSNVGGKSCIVGNRISKASDVQSIMSMNIIVIATFSRCWIYLLRFWYKKAVSFAFRARNCLAHPKKQDVMSQVWCR